MKKFHNEIGNYPVLVSPYGNGGASSRVRAFEWFQLLGITIDAHSYLGKNNNSFSTLVSQPLGVLAAEKSLRALTKSIQSRDLFLSREASPFSNGNLEEQLLSNANRSVYDFDDALFEVRETGLKSIWSKKKTWEKSVRSADLIIAGNEYLADAARDYSSNVIVIPSCVNVSAYSKKLDYEISAFPKAIWLGSPSGERYLLQIADSLFELNRKYGLRLIIVSSRNKTLGALEQLVDRVDWDFDAFHQDLIKADFGIMPLPDDPYTRGKCGYKLLQYASAGLPIIASPVGVNDQFLTELSGLKASSQEEWFHEIEGLVLSSKNSRRKIGQASHKAVTERYDFKVWATTWAANVLGQVRN